MISKICFIVVIVFDGIMFSACLGGLIATSIYDPKCNPNGCYYHSYFRREDRNRNQEIYTENFTIIPESYAYYSSYCYRSYSCNSHGLKQIQGTVFAKMNETTAYVYTQYGVGILASYDNSIINDPSLCGDSSYNIDKVAINRTYLLSQPSNIVQENGIPVYIYNAAFYSDFSCKMYYHNYVRILLYVFLSFGMFIFMLPFVVFLK